MSSSVTSQSFSCKWCSTVTVIDQVSCVQKLLLLKADFNFMYVTAGRVLTSLTNTITTQDSENRGRTRRRNGVVSYKEPSLNR